MSEAHSKVCVCRQLSTCWWSNLECGLAGNHILPSSRCCLFYSLENWCRVWNSSTSV